MSDHIVKIIVNKLYSDEPDEVTVETLSDWLIENGLAEEHRGYGHPEGKRVAEELLARFDISWRAT